MRKSGSAVIVALLCGVLMACDDGKPPAEINDYVARRAGCNHWSGEEGYDAPRRAEINKAETALNCGQIDKDEAALLQRYADRPQWLQQIRAAKDALL